MVFGDEVVFVDGGLWCGGLIVYGVGLCMLGGVGVFVIMLMVGGNCEIGWSLGDNGMGLCVVVLMVRCWCVWYLWLGWILGWF